MRLCLKGLCGPGVVNSGGGGSGDGKVVVPLEGVSNEGDVSTGILGAIPRCDFHVSLRISLPQFPPVSELASLVFPGILQFT